MLNGFLRKIRPKENVSLMSGQYTRYQFCEKHAGDLLPLYHKRFPSHQPSDNRRNAKIRLYDLFESASKEVSNERLRNALVCFGSMPIFAMTAVTRIAAAAIDPVQTLCLGAVIAASGYAFWKAALVLDVYQRNAQQHAPLAKYSDPEIYVRAQNKLTTFLNKPDF